MSKIHNPSENLTKQQNDNLGIQGEDENRGIGCTTIDEPVPNFNRAECEKVIEGKNNTFIVLGRDRPGTKLVSLTPEEEKNRDYIIGPYGPKGYPGCGTIDIVAGRHSADPKPFKKIGKGKSAVEKALVHDPDMFKDAARIYISAKTDVDENFKIGNKRWMGKVIDRNSQGPGAPQSVGESAIALKADAVRVVARTGIKLVTGTDTRDSRGFKKRKPGGIDLIAGNDDEDMQAIIKGKNMINCINSLIKEVGALGGLLSTFMNEQMKINNAFIKHTHVTPFFGLTTAPSEGAIIQGRTSNLKIKTRSFDPMVRHKGNLSSISFNYLEPIGGSYICSKYNRTN